MSEAEKIFLILVIVSIPLCIVLYNSIIDKFLKKHEKVQHERNQLDHAPLYKCGQAIVRTNPDGTFSLFRKDWMEKTYTEGNSHWVPHWELYEYSEMTGMRRYCDSMSIYNCVGMHYMAWDLNLLAGDLATEEAAWNRWAHINGKERLIPMEWLCD